MFKQIMDFLKYIAGIFHEIFKGRNQEAERLDREEMRQNEAAKKEVEIRDTAEDLVKKVQKAKTEDEKQKALDEIRKKISA